MEFAYLGDPPKGELLVEDFAEFQHAKGTIPPGGGGVMPKPARPVDVVNQAAKNGVGMARFRIRRDQAAEIKKLEREHGQDAALRYLLSIIKLR